MAVIRNFHKHHGGKLWAENKPPGEMNVPKAEGKADEVRRRVWMCVHVFKRLIYPRMWLSRKKRSSSVESFSRLTTIHVLGISDIINNKVTRKTFRWSAPGRKRSRGNVSSYLATLMRTRTNYYTFCRFNIFHTHFESLNSALWRSMLRSPTTNKCFL